MVTLCLYELGELLEAVLRATSTRPPERGQLIGLSRNVDLFDATRRWAYPNARRARDAGDFERWSAAVLQAAQQVNAFDHPLPASEVRSVATSVARWTWRHAHTLSASPLGRQRRSALRSRDRPLLLQAEGKARQSAAGEYTSHLIHNRTFDALTAAAAQLAAEGIHSPTKAQLASLAGTSTETVKRCWRNQRMGERKK